MDKVNEYLKKIVKKSGDSQAYYSYNKEFRSTMDKPIFNATIIWSKGGLSPLQVFGYSVEEVVAELKKYHRTTNLDSLKVQYHQNQIHANELSIKHHKKMVETYKAKE